VIILPIDWPAWAIAVMAYVIIQRLAELAYAHANTKKLLQQGGQEHGRKHYPLFVILHSAWIVSIVASANPAIWPNAVLLALLVASQLFRLWTLKSIGRWWTTRIISAPHFPRVRKGPYRYMTHPNYALVVVEIALLPLLLNTPFVAIVFTIANALLLYWRICVESAVLGERGCSDPIL
jgi:methyltransferase